MFVVSLGGGFSCLHRTAWPDVNDPLGESVAIVLFPRYMLPFFMTFMPLIQVLYEPWACSDDAFCGHVIDRMRVEPIGSSMSDQGMDGSGAVHGPANRSESGCVME